MNTTMVRKPKRLLQDDLILGELNAVQVEGANALGEREFEVMNHIWSHPDEEHNVYDVWLALREKEALEGRPEPRYNTIASIMKRLAEKELLSVSKGPGLQFAFTARKSKEEYHSDTVWRTLNRFGLHRVLEELRKRGVPLDADQNGTARAVATAPIPPGPPRPHMTIQEDTEMAHYESGEPSAHTGGKRGRSVKVRRGQGGGGG